MSVYMVVANNIQHGSYNIILYVERSYHGAAAGRPALAALGSIGAEGGRARDPDKLRGSNGCDTGSISGSIGFYTWTFQVVPSWALYETA